jgi:hypothetical protein
LNTSNLLQSTEQKALREIEGTYRESQTVGINRCRVHEGVQSRLPFSITIFCLFSKICALDNGRAVSGETEERKPFLLVENREACRRQRMNELILLQFSAPTEVEIAVVATAKTTTRSSMAVELSTIKSCDIHTAKHEDLPLNMETY